MRKVIYLIISVAVVVSGWIAFDKLNYWERSIRIFTADLSDDSDRIRRGGFEGRGGSDEHGIEQRRFPEMPDSLRRGSGQGRGRYAGYRNMPDSARRIFEEGRSIRNGNRPDSLRRNTEFQQGRESGIRGMGGHGRGSYNSKKVYLTNVWLFLAVFALSTVVAIYFDKIIVFIRRRKIRG